MFYFISWRLLCVSKNICSSSGRPFVHAVFMVCFSCVYVTSLAGGRLDCQTAYINAWKTYHKKLHVQTVFLVLNTWCSKHVADTKNWIKTLIWKRSLFWFKLHNQERTRVGTLTVATIYLQLIQNRYMFRSFTVFHCSHQHCVQPVASDVEVVGYL